MNDQWFHELQKLFDQPYLCSTGDNLSDPKEFRELEILFLAIT